MYTIRHSESCTLKRNTTIVIVGIFFCFTSKTFISKLNSKIVAKMLWFKRQTRVPCHHPGCVPGPPAAAESSVCPAAPPEGPLSQWGPRF